MLGPIIKNGLAVRIDKGVLPEQEEYERFIFISPKSGHKSTVLADFARSEEWLRMCLTKAACVMHINPIHGRSLKFSTHINSFYKPHDSIPGYPGAAYRFKANNIEGLEELGRKTRFTWQAACGPAATMVFADHETEKDNQLYLTARVKVTDVTYQAADEKLINVREFINAQGQQGKKKKRQNAPPRRKGQTITGDAATDGEVSVDTIKALLGDAAPEVKVTASSSSLEQELAAVDQAVDKALGAKAKARMMAHVKREISIVDKALALANRAISAQKRQASTAMPLAQPPLKRQKNGKSKQADDSAWVSGDGSQVPPHEVLDNMEVSADELDETPSKPPTKTAKTRGKGSKRKGAKPGLDAVSAEQRMWSKFSECTAENHEVLFHPFDGLYECHTCGFTMCRGVTY